MNFLLVVLIVGVLAIIGIFVSSHYRNKDGYKRVFTNGAPERRRRFAGETSSNSADSSFAAWSLTGGADGGQHSHLHGSDCGTGHGGGDAGGSCSDGGGGH